MRSTLRVSSMPGTQCVKLVLIAALGLVLNSAATFSQARSLDELVSAVVQVRTTIEPEGRTADTLGRERDGSGIVIDNDGLVLTIGYLMVEARAAEISTGDGRTV